MSSGTADALGLSRAILCNGESPPPTQLWPPGSQAWAFFRGRGIMATHQAIVGPTGLALAPACGAGSHHLYIPGGLSSSQSTHSGPLSCLTTCVPPTSRQGFTAQVTDEETCPSGEAPFSSS